MPRQIRRHLTLNCFDLQVLHKSFFVFVFLVEFELFNLLFYLMSVATLPPPLILVPLVSCSVHCSLQPGLSR